MEANDGVHEKRDMKNRVPDFIDLEMPKNLLMELPGKMVYTKQHWSAVPKRRMLFVGMLLNGLESVGAAFLYFYAEGLGWNAVLMLASGVACLFACFFVNCLHTLSEEKRRKIVDEIWPLKEQAEEKSNSLAIQIANMLLANALRSQALTVVDTFEAYWYDKLHCGKKKCSNCRQIIRGFRLYPETGKVIHRFTYRYPKECPFCTHIML